MCVVSMIYDHYKPEFDKFDWNWPPQQTVPAVPVIDSSQIKKFEKLLEEFREALEAAKKVDKLTKQPDCEDPEKAKLLDRVEKLEKEILLLKKSKSLKKKTVTKSKKK